MEETTDEQIFIETTLLNRLHEAGRRGLLEAVVVAAVTHRAHEFVGSVSAVEVKKVLKNLAESGRVSHSAGRWRRLR